MTALIRKLQAGLLLPIYVLEKALQCLDTSFKYECSEGGGTSATSLDGDSLKQVTCSDTAEAGPVTEEDQKAIMEHVYELFGLLEPVTEEDQKAIMEHVYELFGVAEPVTEEDQKAIMEHVCELFGVAEPVTEEDQKAIMEHVYELFGIDVENPADTGSITERDQMMIMRHIDEFFTKGWRQGGEEPSLR